MSVTIKEASDTNNPSHSKPFAYAKPSKELSLQTTKGSSVAMQVVLKQPCEGDSLLSISSKAASQTVMQCGDVFKTIQHHGYFSREQETTLVFYGLKKAFFGKRAVALPLLPYSDRIDADTKIVAEEMERYLKDNTHPDAQYHMAHGLLQMTREHNKKVEVANRFKAAGEQGHLPALVDYAICLENGFGTRMDVNQAVEIYENAARLGDPNAQYALATFLLSRPDVVERDVNYAIYLLRQAVEKHHSRAQFLLGSCYADGIGVPKDDKIAVDLFFQATVEGEARALAAIGKKPSNLASPDGIRWIRKKLEPRDLRADFELGMRYLEGRTLVHHLGQAISRFEAVVRANLTVVARQKADWYYSSDSENELKKLQQNETRAIALLGICYQKRASTRTLQALNPDDLLSFHFTKKSEQVSMALISKEKLVFQTEEDRTQHSLGYYRDPLADNFASLLKMLPNINDLNTFVLSTQTIKSTGTTEVNMKPLEFVDPRKNLVLWHNGNGNIILDVRRIECANLYIVSEKGNVIFEESTIVKA